jgi:hypothetical protein
MVFQNFSAENCNFSQHFFGGGKFSAEFSAEFSLDKMYEKSAPECICSDRKKSADGHPHGMPTDQEMAQRLAKLKASIFKPGFGSRCILGLCILHIFVHFHCLLFSVHF